MNYFQDLTMTKTKNIIKITKKEELRDIILSGKFDDSIQVKNTEHICKDGSIYDYSEITDLSYMFENNWKLRIIPLFDTSNVTNMSHMFMHCDILSQVPLFDTSNVTNMSSMFFRSCSLETVPLFDTSNVIDMGSMFENCWDLKTVPQFNVYNVTNLFACFSCCWTLEEVKLLNVNNVTDFGHLFAGCSSLTIIDINFNNIKPLKNLNFEDIFLDSTFQKIKQIEFLYQNDNFVLKLLKEKKELFSNNKIDKLLSEFKK